ncbi:DUF3090 domain-containing protein [Dehalococcoidia bacterium]|nr:DUF3090 domain-containing protein [Dehalococcoidia bacterium]
MTSPGPANDLGRVDKLIPQAIGRPGQRRFCLVFEGSDQWVVSWLEKEQLQELSLSILRQLGPLSGSEKILQQFDFDSVRIDLEFKLASTTLRLDKDTGLFFIEMHERGASSMQPKVGFTGSMSVVHEMAAQALEICAAGRPLCPLCHTPLDNEVTHICPLSNGHHGV